MQRTAVLLLAALGLWAGLGAAPPAWGETWLDAARPSYLRPGEIAPARAAPFVPRETRRVNLDSKTFVERGPATVREEERHAFVPLHKGGIFNYEPEARIYVPPRADIHNGNGVVSHGFFIRPNGALYGNGAPVWGNESFRAPLGRRGYSLSPRVLNLESRRR